MATAEISNANININFNSANAIKDAEKSKSKFASIAGSIKKAFSLGGVGAGILSGFSMKTAYDETLKLVNISDKFSLPIEEVSRFNNMLSLFGGNTDSAENAIDRLSGAMTELLTTGGGALKQIATQAGISLYNMDGKLKNGIELFDSLRQAFKKLNKDAKLQVAQELGLDSPEHLRMLTASDEEYAQMLEKSKNMLVLNEKQKQNTLQMQRTLASMKSSFVGVGASLLESAEPFIKLLDSGLQKFNALDDDTKEMIAKLMLFAPAMMPALKTTFGLVKFFGDFNSAISLSKVGIGGMAKMLGIAGFQITAIAGTIYGTYKVAKWFADKWGDKKADELADHLNSDEYDKNEGLERLKRSKTYQSASEEEKKEMEIRFLENQKRGRGEKYQSKNLQETSLQEQQQQYQPIPSTTITNSSNSTNNNNTNNTSNDNRQNNITNRIVINAGGANADDVFEVFKNLQYGMATGVR